jgi:2-dehydro-3-deoxyphosphogluconate aldolase/(4S)-4-hydroxy-2-oxoglutarate aldolase
MNELNKKLYEVGLIPVIKIEDAEKAVPLARALCEGGLPAAEITFRTAAAADAIRNIKKALPDMLLGAGTVLTTEQADAAIEAGASFIVAPGLNPEVVKHCQKKGIPMLPGCSSPTDVETALSLGLDTVKFFPAEAAGGLKMLKAMSAPYGKLSFMPTGGIDETNLLSYLQFNKIIACGGSFMVKDALISAGDFDTIRELTRKAVLTMLGFEFYHVGINAENEEESKKAAAWLTTLFGIPMADGRKSYMGDNFEIMKFVGVGSKGHIGIKTNFLDRAMAYLSRLGVEFDESSITYNDAGKPKFVYIKGEILGFAFHLVQK